MRYSFILFLVVLFGCQPKYDVPVIIEIDKGWEFRQVGDSIWNSATVPGNIFSDLLINELIEDPFIGANEEKVQWVSETDWEYRTIFSLEESILNNKHIELNFEGLDTYASVYLNDSLILSTNNAFREWKVNIKPILQSENEIRIVFEPTSKYEDIEKNKLPYDLPEGNRVFTRKAQFQYGWDWGPKLNTIGIWRSIELTAWDEFKFENIHVKQLELNENKAELLIDLSENGPINADYQYDVLLNDSLVIEFKNPNPLTPPWIPLTIKQPRLWWPHNLGKPYLYDIKVIAKRGQTILDTFSIKKGLRTIDLVTDKDSIGESFYFKVNGEPIYAKGANYIPQHSFQNEISYSDYDNLLNDVVDANMNMLRVWGGGIYEEDVFYKLCDEKGILVWQDFMFACAMYPGDEAFLENVQYEAEQQVKRLRHHASLALWCGNNENSEGWHRWGWQSGRNEAEKREIWNNYLKVFDSILPRTVSTHSNTDYWESSPKYGRGNPKYKTEGDAHDWWIWHDAYPFEHLLDNVPRFMSEFGFQSFPSYETIRYINQQDSLDLDSESFKSHQRHSRGFELIYEYMERDFPIPTISEEYVYMSQLLQAYGITQGIEAQRRSKPYNMGTLYWQLNDCWPAISWSSIDFFGNWKALHYKAKQSFQNTQVSTKLEKGHLKVWLINDSLEALQGELKMEFMDFSGKVLRSVKRVHSASPNSSDMVYEWPLHNLDIDFTQVVLVTEFLESKRVHWFSSPKRLKLQQQLIDKRISQVKDGYLIQLSSTTLQKDVFLYSDSKGHFSHNFIDMLPGETYSIHFKSNEVLEDLQVITFNNFIR